MKGYRARNVFSAALMRVCQPAPVALNRSTMSRSSLSVTDTFRSGFGGRPARLTTPATGDDRSGAASGSATIPRAILASSLRVGRMSFSFIELNLAAVGLASRNDAALAAPLDKDDDMQPRAERGHRNQPGFAIVSSPVFENHGPFPIQAS